MPTSSPEHKPEILNWFKTLDPKFVVDIGIGCGTYSDLLKKESSAYWTGVEVWAPYINKYGLEKKYDEIIVGDIRYLDLQMIDMRPDLVIIGDCLEHLVLNDALDLMLRLQGWAKNIFLSLPIGDCPQGAWEGNAFERHLSTWEHDQVRSMLIRSGWIVEERQGSLLSAFWWTKA